MPLLIGPGAISATIIYAGDAQRLGLAGVDDGRRDRARADQQRHGEGHHQPFEPAPGIAAGVHRLMLLGRIGEGRGHVSARHVQAQEQQQDAPCDPERGQGDAEEPEQAEAGEIEEGQEAQREQGDVERHPAPAGGAGAGRGRGEHRHVPDRIDQGEHGHEEVDAEFGRAHG